MPRTTCELCLNKPIIYRVYIDDNKAPKNIKSLTGIKYQICQSCAESLLKEGSVFNLRRILSKVLGTSRREEEDDYS